jgi:uncharacterized membrane protein
MNRSFVSVALAAAVGLAFAAESTVAMAQQGDPKVIEKTKERIANGHLEKCYGLAEAGFNDCATGQHGCAGLAKVAADPDSFILVPEGTCTHFKGGKTVPMHQGKGG